MTAASMNEESKIESEQNDANEDEDLEVPDEAMLSPSHVDKTIRDSGSFISQS